MKRLTCVLAAAAALVVFSAPAVSRPGPNGETVIIIGVDARTNGQVIIAVDRQPAGYACANPRFDVYSYLIDVTTDAGQAVYASALFAASSRAQVVIQGTGQCTQIFDENDDKLDVEDVDRIYSLVNG
jgi:uncharacterized protein (DUF2141 family)